MVIISYIIKHIITNKNKILHKLFYALFAPYNKKKWKKYRICFRIHTEFYIYHLRKYRMNLRFTFYESLQAQCSKQEYKFVYKILYPIYSQSKKNDQKTDYRIITVSDRFQPYMPDTYSRILCATLSANYYIQTREILVLENLYYQRWWWNTARMGPEETFWFWCEITYTSDLTLFFQMF